jgi:hypothetical protein
MKVGTGTVVDAELSAIAMGYYSQSQQKYKTMWYRRRGLCGTEHLLDTFITHGDVRGVKQYVFLKHIVRVANNTHPSHVYLVCIEGKDAFIATVKFDNGAIATILQAQERVRYTSEPYKDQARLSYSRHLRVSLTV